MNWFRRRKLKKAAGSLIKESNHVQYLREDVAAPEEIEALKGARTALVEARYRRGIGEAELLAAMDALGQAVQTVNPPRPAARFRENLDVLVVAIAAAMAIRAYFVQPFKIPTGSMQPTLNGILEIETGPPGLLDRHPFRAVKWLITGTTRQADGYDKTAGDHILVNRVKYNFIPPKRGDVVVFDTRGIRLDERQMVMVTAFTETGAAVWQMPFMEGSDGALRDAATARTFAEWRQELDRRAGRVLRYTAERSEKIALTYYIKRLAGLPGENIQIRDSRLWADGELVDSPTCFVRQYTAPGYDGYSNIGKLHDPAASIQLAEDEFLPLGDNTLNSQDGRFFGGVKLDAVLGPAFFVYWPFGQHWGPVN